MHEVSLCLADRVRKLRTKLALTQAALAKRAGVTVETIARLERVSRGAKSADFNPTLDTLLRLATALEVEISELLASQPAKSVRGNRLSVLLQRAHPDRAHMIVKVVEALLADDKHAKEHWARDRPSIERSQRIPK